MFHFGNSNIGAVNKLAGLDYRFHIRIQTDAFGHQRNILALHVGNLGLGFRTFAAFLVYNGITDSVKQLLFRPGVFRVRVLIHY